MKYFIAVFTLLMLFTHSGYPQEHNHGTPDKTPTPKPGENVPDSQVWTCSMHPQLRLLKPGKCPICHMDLIPIEDPVVETPPSISRLQLSSSAQALADIQTTAAKHKHVNRSLRLLGTIDYDETRIKQITSWTAGRIERLFVDFTGMTVRKGDHLVSLYSPALLSAQEELLQALVSSKKLGVSANQTVKRSTDRTVRAAREKLRLLGLSPEQIRIIESKNTPSDQLTIFSPIGGVVVEKNVSEGMYVDTGSRIYTVADLSHLWVNLEAYETDLPWLRYGQRVEFITQAVPGKSFQGIVSFINPFLDATTRTAKVRVNVENNEALLKPGMFVTAYVKSALNSKGEPISPDYTGKLLCPMHPEIVSNSPGNCPICEMTLVSPDSLPFLQASTTKDTLPPLLIPATAPLITGDRAVVFVKDPGTATFTLRKLRLGPRAESSYVVLEGLSEGEIVVTNGSFKIDADLQIRGRASMINSDPAHNKALHRH